MAFESNGLSSDSLGVSGNIPSRWAYSSADDTLADMQVSGYFDEAFRKLSSGDTITLVSLNPVAITTVLIIVTGFVVSVSGIAPSGAAPYCRTFSMDEVAVHVTGNPQTLGADAPPLISGGTQNYDTTRQFKRQVFMSVQMKDIIPDSWVPGSDLQVTAFWKMDSAGTGTVLFGTNSSFVVAGETAIPAPIVDTASFPLPATTTEAVTSSFLIDGEDISPGDQATISFFRDAATDPSYDDDTLVGLIRLKEIR